MTQVGINYGSSLYDLAKEENITEEILHQLHVLDASFGIEPAFLRLLSTPGLTKDERLKILDESFRGNVHIYVLNFLKLLTEKGYARYFGDCRKAFEDRYNQDNGILPVLAVSAVALSESQSEKLTEKLAQITGKKVKLSNRVDPSCLGGVRLRYDGNQVDGTVKNRLDTIGNLLKNTVL